MATNWAQVFRQNEYEDARRERNALELMELGFKQEERQRQRERQEESDARQREKFEDYETAQKVLNIESQFKPLITTLADPSNVSREDLKGIRESLDLLSSDSMLYKEGSMEKNSIDTQIIGVTNLLENTETFLDANEKFDNIRKEIDKKLISKDDQIGSYNIRNTSNIVDNAQALATSKFADQNKDYARAVSLLTEEAKRYNFVASELKRYQDNPLAVGNQKTMVDLARRAAESEDINLAYNILAKVPEDVQAARAGMPTVDDLQGEYLRKFAKTQNDQIKIYADNSGNYKDQLKVIAQSISDEKGNFMDDPARLSSLRTSFEGLMNLVQGNTNTLYPDFAPSFGFKNGFEKYEKLISQARYGRPNDLESLALVSSGAVKKEGNKLFYADGTIYMDSSGKVVNAYNPFKYNENWWQENSSVIENNAKKIKYKPKDGGNELSTRQGISRAAKMYLMFATKDRQPDELKDISPNVNEEKIKSQISSGRKIENQNTTTEPPTMIANTPTGTLSGRASVGTGDDYFSGVKSIFSQMRETQKNQKQINAERKLSRLKSRLAGASPSKVTQLKRQIDKQQEIVDRFKKESLASK